MNIISPKISSIVFGIVSTAFCGLVTDSCVLLFFQNPASKSRSLLITIEASNIKNSNPIQTNYDSNVHIATFDHEPCTNILKPFFLDFLCVLCVLCGEFVFAELLSTN
jgi:hypothetical protein